MMRRDPFQAIADPNRRAILALIARESMNLNTVASHFSVSRPAISKHIKILRQCGLVEIRQKGRERFCEARLERLSEVVAWLEDYRSQWSTEIQTQPVAFMPAPQKEDTIQPLAEISVTKEEPIATAHVPAETAAAIEIGETLTEIMEQTATTVVDLVEEVNEPDTALPATAEESTDAVPTASEPEIEVIATDIVELTADTTAIPAKASVPWEEGYVEEEEPVVIEEIDLSAESLLTSSTLIAEQTVTSSVDQTEQEEAIQLPSDIIQVDEILVASEPEPQPQSDTQADVSTQPEVTPSVTPARKPATRKKKESPPTESLQGSLF